MGSNRESVDKIKPVLLGPSFTTKEKDKKTKFFLKDDSVSCTDTIIKNDGAGETEDMMNTIKIAFIVFEKNERL